MKQRQGTIKKSIIISMRKLIFFSIMTFGLFSAGAAAGQDTPAAVIKSEKFLLEGRVLNNRTKEPITYATIQVLGTGKSTLTNEDGRYRLWLSTGLHEVKFSHVAYFSDSLRLELSDGNVTRDIYLEPTFIELPGTRVYSRAYDPGQRIIIEAIKRKKDILSKINDYNFDAYTKLVIEEVKDDSTRIFLIAESQVTSYWEQPDKYKEVITARRQTSNLPAEGNLVSVGEILNFNKNRVDIGRYAVVSPTAKDALDYYNYYLLDTVIIDGRAVFRLEIEPQNEVDPLFAGFIHIADSSYDVVAVNVGVNQGVEFPFLSNLRYRQDFVRLQGDFWMPVKIQFSGEVHIDFPFPGIPSDMNFAHVASLYNYEFDTGLDEIFDEYELVVTEDADDHDSASWNGRQTIPLSAYEQAGYDRIDSVENAPKPIWKKMLQIGVGTMAFMTFGGNYDLFHYNRVEGAYLGLGLDLFKKVPNTDLWFKSGYAFKPELWQHKYGFSYEYWKKRKAYFGGEYRDLVVPHPTEPTVPTYNPTFLALLGKYDQFDYYREKGWRVFTGLKPVKHTRLHLEYDDFNQYPLATTEHYSVFRNELDARSNPPAAQGKLRSVKASFSYDSRMRYKNKNRDLVGFARQYTELTARVEYADPDFIDNDFNFTRYSMSFMRQQRLFGMGYTSLYVYGGETEGDPPPQKYFAVDFGSEIFINNLGFYTLNETNFYGDRVLLITLEHEFDRFLLRRSGLPLLKKLPFTLSVHGGVFWAEMDEDKNGLDGYFYPTANRPYREIGFGVGNITPFLNPFNLYFKFTWQLSDYATSDFAVHWDFRL
ncbi:MAG: DUF5686 family protein [Candidatus Zixiibacteriota bacterium]